MITACSKWNLSMRYRKSLLVLLEESKQVGKEDQFNRTLTTKNLLLLILGGLLVGFGTRYAGGCTSGHAITGLSSLQKPSLIAVIGFFIGGLIMTNLLLPLIF